MDKLQWDNFVLANNGSFLQSWEWGELQRELGKQLIRFQEPGFTSSLTKNKLPLGRNYLYAARGPAWENITSQTLLDFIQKTKEVADPATIFIRLEPEIVDNDETRKILTGAGCQPVAMVQPSTTLILGLDKSEEELLNDMEHDTRYAIRTAEKRGVIIQQLTDHRKKGHHFDVFWRIFAETNKKHHLKMYAQNYYREILLLSGNLRSELFIATLDDRPIAAAIVVFFGNKASYLYAGSLSGYGRYNAPTLILWRAITAAQKYGCKFFDFWGISDRNSKWASITAFKKSFGGRKVNYIGTWDYPLNKKWYLIYQLARKLIR